MVFHPQEFGNVATCCAYLEGAGLGPGAAVARSDGVAWRRVSINYSHNYSRRPAASRCSPSPTSAAIPNCNGDGANARSKGVCVSLCIYQTSYRGEASSSIRTNEMRRSSIVASSRLSRVIAQGEHRVTWLWRIRWKRGGAKIRVFQWFSMVLRVEEVKFCFVLLIYYNINFFL